MDLVVARAGAIHSDARRPPLRLRSTPNRGKLSTTAAVHLLPHASVQQCTQVAHMVHRSPIAPGKSTLFWGNKFDAPMLMSRTTSEYPAFTGQYRPSDRSLACNSADDAGVSPEIDKCFSEKCRSTDGCHERLRTPGSLLNADCRCILRPGHTLRCTSRTSDTISYMKAMDQMHMSEQQSSGVDL